MAALLTRRRPSSVAVVPAAALLSVDVALIISLLLAGPASAQGKTGQVTV
jgi:hypothetical protein